MTRLWLARMARGAGASLLLGATLGGIEAWWLLLHTTMLFGPMERLGLWALAIASTGAVAAVLGLVLAAVFGSILGHDEDSRGLARDTGRDPRYPWLPWVLAVVMSCVLLLQALPTMFSAAGKVAALLLVAALLGGVLFGGFLRWFFVRLDTTGKGAALAIMGLPCVLVVTSSLVVSAPLAGGKGHSVAARSGLPNLLLITVDGLRADHVGPGSRVRTNALDWIASKGVYFRQASTPTTAEGPPCGAILTGRHPLVTGFLADGQRLPAVLPGGSSRADLPTLAEVLAREKFVTAAFVSSAAVDGDASGLLRGFTVYDDDVAPGTRGALDLGIPQLWSWLRYSVSGTAPLNEVLRPGSETIDRFEHWLSYHYRENLFVWLQLSDPLNPSLQPGVEEAAVADAIAGAQGRAYGERVVALDELLGGLMTRLEARGLLDRTAVAIVGTRGVVPGAGRTDVSEPWTQVPVLLYGAGLDLEREVNTQVRLHDLYPTLLAAVGLLRPPRGDAASLVPLIEGKSITALKSLTVSSPRPDGRCSVALRTQDWKYHRQASGGQSFYDLRRDPRELHDLSETRAAEFEAAAREVTGTLGSSAPVAVVPPGDPGRAARLRALGALR